MWSLNSRLTLTKIQIQYSHLYSNATFKSNDFRILIFICNTCIKKIRILGKHWCSDSCIYITGNDLCVCTIILKVSVKKLVQRNYQYRPIRINVIYTHCCIRITTNYQIENLQYVNLKIDSLSFIMISWVLIFTFYKLLQWCLNLKNDDYLLSCLL